ncbi:MAG: hypothetical protein R3E95_23925 [Thiolinea sp.]
MKYEDYDDYGLDYRPTSPPPRYPAERIDWPLVARFAPWLICVMGWCLWLFFLLIPTVYSLHGTDLYPFENNLMFVLTGLVLALASSTAWDMNHRIRTALFVGVIAVLCYWF